MNGASRRRINRFLKDHTMDGIKPKKRCDEAAILDCIGDGVMMIGLDMRVRYMNRAMRELLGYEQGEVQRRRCRWVQPAGTGTDLLDARLYYGTGPPQSREGDQLRDGHPEQRGPADSGQAEYGSALGRGRQPASGSSKSIVMSACSRSCRTSSRGNLPKELRGVSSSRAKPCSRFSICFPRLPLQKRRCCSKARAERARS